MNTIGFVISLFSIVFLHTILKVFMNIKKEQEQLIEKFKNKLKPKKIDHTLERQEIDGKNKYYNGYQFKKVDFDKIEDEDGYDIDNEYDLMKEDLLKYIDSMNNYYEFEKIAQPIANKKLNKELNPNIPIKEPVPLDKKSYTFKPEKVGKSLDDQYKTQFEMNNKTRNKLIENKTLKPDLWTYKEEKPMNGGFVDPMTNLMPYDAMEESNYVLL
jgi:hypothetical protein